MKIFAYYYLLATLLFGGVSTSCVRGAEELEVVSKGFSLTHQKQKEKMDAVRIPSTTLGWDESYRPSKVVPPFVMERERSSLRSLSTPLYGNESHEMAVLSKSVYLGKLYPASSIQDLTYGDGPLAGVRAEDITITFLFPPYFSKKIAPNTSTMTAALYQAVSHPDFSGEQTASFAYDYRSFSQYSELKLAFGANVNVASIFKLDASLDYKKIKSKSGLFARVYQRYFDVVMDYPEDGNIFRNNDDLAKYASCDPVYINSMAYGRSAIIAIESEESYEDLKTAFKATLQAKKVGVGLEISTRELEIMKKATIRMIVNGGRGADVGRLAEGLNEFVNFLVNGGEFTKKSHGVPITITANYAASNGMFRTKFVTEQ